VLLLFFSKKKKKSFDEFYVAYMSGLSQGKDGCSAIHHGRLWAVSRRGTGAGWQVFCVDFSYDISYSNG
jgi:hypothetical protein